MKMKKRIVVLLMALVLAVGLIGCKDTLQSIVRCGTAEGTQRFKVAVWKKVDGGAEYVTDSTYYIHTDGTDYRCTISGLDPAAQYRVTISYDSSKYYLYGLLKVEGIG